MKTINDTFEKVYLICDTDKNAIEYTPGETVKFEIKLYGDDELISAPFIEYELCADEDKNNKTHEYVSAESGVIRVEYTTSKPCFVKLNAFVCDSEKKRIDIKYPLYAGACAGFDEIRQHKDEPADFDEFWAKSLALLPTIESVAARVQVRELSGIAPEGYKSFEVMVPAVNDNTRPATAIMTYPENAKEGTLKLRCAFQGYGITPPAATYMPDYICFSVSSHGFAIGQPDYYYNYDYLGLQGFGFKNNDKPETVYFRNMILRDVQMVRYAMTSKLWNGKDLWCAGGSMGAFQTSAVSALLNDVVTEVSVFINWMCDIGGEEIRINGWRPQFTDALKYYDTVNFAKRIKAPINIAEAGLGDYVSPPSGIACYFNEVKAKGQTSIKATFIQNRSHGGDTHPAGVEQRRFSKEFNK
ncbi:MAG: acetylxylan esterase [Clostridia bacterium]|nr:acetylxylan esterase [Clostridia bacterium]